MEWKQGMNWSIVRGRFYDSFEPRDLRKTYLIASYTNNKGETVDREHPGNPDKHLDVGPIPLKYGYDINVVGNGGKSSIDPIIYRYADVYLSLAEALCRNLHRLLLTGRRRLA